MCGIVGLFDLRGQRAIDRAMLERMNDAILHRGPDSDGFHLEPGVGLAMRRLAIIDLSGGNQPLYNEDGSVGVVYNGQIYNFQSLTPELQAKGHGFRTVCDTEVVVHAWEEWGEACVERFNGMFAFAIWDRAKRRLFLARDRLGEKPLYWTVLPDGMFAFASELKALLTLPGLERRIEPRAVEQYFAYGYVPEPLTILRGVFKLEPGHSITLEQGQETVRPKRYWDVRFTQGPAGTEADLRHELIERLSASVRMRMISDVPLGAFLSGGVDSSAIVAMMAELSPVPVNTFCIAFQQPDFDESGYAAKIAERYRTNHVVETVDADAIGPIDRLAQIYDEPFGDSSALPTLKVCELARKKVTVALSGDGGDEVFAGYRRYLWHVREQQIRASVPDGIRRGLFGMLGAVYPKLDWAPRFLRAKTTFQELASDPVEAYMISVSETTDPERAAIFSSRLKADLQRHRAVEVLAGHIAAAGTDDPLAAVQYADLKTWLSGRMLVKVDRASMAVSLEVRVPMLDHTFVEWAASLPSGLKLNGQERKFILKRALEPKVPDDLLYRPKQGFSTPLARWFRGPLRERIRAALLGPALGGSGLFDMTEIARRLEDHAAGRRDHAALLWNLWMFEGFLRNTGARA
ncbi:XrtA/PEP-CTERM system amidotransferase [Desertibaculum subflavum]|uniref:XrtA/PEP-CTERM system amidotransferase n=1 Tax=Desertibaculum subflavum TaxID=2268458 RepID=UPI000E670C42